MKRFVIIDVETTGVSFEKGDKIIQIAFVVLEGGKIVDRFSSYLQPGRSIPPFIQSLTQIGEEEIKDAPLFEEVVPTLLEALDGSFFVAHNVEFDLQFINAEIEAAGYAPYVGPVLDTVELSRIAFPTARSFKLSQLSEGLDMDHDQPHRADSDAEATTQLLIEILDKLSDLPYETLSHLDKLKSMFKSDLNSLLHEWMEANRLKTDDRYDYFRGLALKKQNTQSTSIRDQEEIPNFEDFFQNQMSNDLWCKERLPDYEERLGQLEMMSFCYEAMKDRQIGLIEAGTGTGKSLAYLIPAIFLAKEKEKPVVVSTHTIQLQEQLEKNEIKKAQMFLPFTIKTAILKGRNHYLCLRKFENLLENDPFENYDRAVSKAQILIWLTETETGDVEELSLASHQQRFWYDISSDSISSNMPNNPWLSRCFYLRSRNNAKDADIIITNHSFVLSDVKAEHQLIPSYDHIIIDEAHHLEDIATDLFGVELDYLSLTHALNELGEKNDEGLLSLLLKVKKGDDTITEKVHALKDASFSLKEEWSELFRLLSQYVKRKHGNLNEQGRTSLEMNTDTADWEPIGEIVDRFVHHYKDWEAQCSDLYMHLTEESYREKDSGMINNLRSIIDRGKEVFSSFATLFLTRDSSMVYWLELEGKGSKQYLYIYGKPVEVSEQLADEFFNKKESVILTSATMTVNNSFDYFIHRLGLEDFATETKVVQSPFDWENQVQLMVPTDMPLIKDSGEEAYIEAIVMQIYRVATVSKGKMLVLFTSYDMLKKSYYLLKDLLSEEFNLIAQGIQTGSRTKLTRNFQEQDRAILLGTSSFWEGVDIPGKELSVIVIVRLPFSPPNNPVFQAKSAKLKEEGKNSFMKLALPQAILRFKQGFGRLIRRSSDKGVVLVLDRRLVEARYGKMFMKSLPPVTVLDQPMDELEDELERWL